MQCKVTRIAVQILALHLSGEAAQNGACFTNRPGFLIVQEGDAKECPIGG